MFQEAEQRRNLDQPGSPRPVREQPGDRTSGLGNAMLSELNRLLNLQILVGIRDSNQFWKRKDAPETESLRILPQQPSSPKTSATPDLICEGCNLRLELHY